MAEFAALGPKAYSYLTDNEDTSIYEIDKPLPK